MTLPIKTLAAATGIGPAASIEGAIAIVGAYPIAAAPR